MGGTSINLRPAASNCDAARYPLYTAGYASFLDAERHPSLEVFVAALQSFHVGCVVDVRSSPYGSTYYADYSMEKLKKILKYSGISYQHFGQQFGARPSDAKMYIEGRADFSRMSATPLFLDGCRRITEDGLWKMPICLMCSEKDPLTCHRTILVAHHIRLLYPGVSILHIQYGKGQGSDDIVPEGEQTKDMHLFAETQEHADTRILREENLEKPKGMMVQGSLFATKTFASHAERLAEAYHRRELKIAWKRRENSFYEEDL